MEERATLERRLSDLEAIYREHHGFVWRSLYHYGLRDEALQDAVQDVFLVVHRRLGDFDGTKAIRNWLYGIARRVAADHRKKNERRRTRLKLVPDPEQGADHRREFDQMAAAQQVDRLLQVLDEEKREVFVLSEVEGMTAPEIADTLELNVNTVYARLRAARKRFERELERQAVITRRQRAWSR